VRFFQERSNGLRRDLLHKAQLDRFAREHAQRPMVVPIWHLAAGNGDEVRLLLAREGLAMAGLPLMTQHRIYPAFRETSAHVEDRVAADVERPADLRQAPALPQFEQDLGARAQALCCPEWRKVDKRERSISDRTISSLERAGIISAEGMVAVVSVIMSTSFCAHQHTPAVNSLLD
jgi:hypothetical protein